MRLILVRHGQTDYNLHRRYQGKRNVSLNQTGREQTKRLANRLSAEKMDSLHSSDLTRCVQTAESIAGIHSLKIHEDACWRELSFGEWEGMSYAEIEAAWPELLQKWQTDPAHVSPPKGESFVQLAARVSSALDEMRSHHAEQTVLLVTHGGVIRALLCLALGIDLNRHWQFEVASASVSEISYYGEGAILKLFNDTSHLRE